MQYQNASVRLTQRLVRKSYVVIETNYIVDNHHWHHIWSTETRGEFNHHFLHKSITTWTTSHNSKSTCVVSFYHNQTSWIKIQPLMITTQITIGATGHARYHGQNLYLSIFFLLIKACMKTGSNVARALSFELATGCKERNSTTQIGRHCHKRGTQNL